MVREKELPIHSSSPKSIFIRLQLPAGEAVSAPPLSATLGQVQINSSDFCKTFNSTSLQLFEPGVLVNVDLYKNPDNSYYFYIKGISISYLLFQSCNEYKFIPVEVLYDLFRIKLLSTGKPFNFYTVKLLFGSIRAIKFRILL